MRTAKIGPDLRLHWLPVCYRLEYENYRDRQHFCVAKAWLHRCVVTQLEKERKIGN